MNKKVFCLADDYLKYSISIRKIHDYTSCLSADNWRNPLTKTEYVYDALN